MPCFLSDAQIETALAIFAHIDECALSPDLQQQLQQLRSHLLYTSQAGIVTVDPSLPSSSPSPSRFGNFPLGNFSVSDSFILSMGFLS